MFRTPVLTTLEEDLKKIGLSLNEEGPEKKAPEGEPSSNKATSARNVGAMTDEPTEKGGTGTDEMPGAPHTGKKAKVNPAAKDPRPETEAGDKQEAIKGMPDKKRAVESDESDDDDDDDDKDDDKKSKKSDDEDSKDEAVKPSATSLAIEAVVKARSKAEGRSFDHVSKLIEDANEIMESIDKSRRSESVKAFANVSIMAEMLHRGIGTFAERADEKELGEAAEAFGLMANEAAEIAKAIEEGEDLDENAVAGEFRNQVDALLQGLDFYSDIMESLQSEAEEIAEGEDDGDNDEDDGEDDANSDDDGDDAQSKKKEEAVRLEPGVKTDRGQAASIVKSLRKGGLKMKKGSTATGGSVLPKTVHRVENSSGKAESYLPYGKGKAKK